MSYTVSLPARIQVIISIEHHVVLAGGIVVVFPLPCGDKGDTG